MNKMETTVTKQSDEKERLGAILKAIRTKQGLGLTKTAEQVGIAKGSLSNIEIGRKKPSMDVLRKICKALNVYTGMVLLLVDDYVLDWGIEEQNSDFAKKGGPIVRKMRKQLLGEIGLNHLN